MLLAPAPFMRTRAGKARPEANRQKHLARYKETGKDNFNLLSLTVLRAGLLSTGAESAPAA
jgi:hypothetical protein